MVNIHTYDYHGHWFGTTGHHSPISRIQSAKDPSFNVVCVDFLLVSNSCQARTWFCLQEDIAQYYVSNGLSKAKINIGLPFYGQTFMSKSASVGAQSQSAGSPGPSTNQQGMLSYSEICKMVKSNKLKTSTTPEGLVFAHDRSTGLWVSYDNIKAIAEKAKFVMDKG